MAKRKIKTEEDLGAGSSSPDVSNEEELDGSPPPVKKAKSGKSKILPTAPKDEPSSKQEETPLSMIPQGTGEEKNGTKRRGATESSDGNINACVRVNSEGDKYIDLGKKKRITIRSFKGQPLVDIREFYGNDGEEKPGKKGISLTIQQWAELEKSAAIIGDLVTKLSK